MILLLTSIPSSQIHNKGWNPLLSYTCIVYLYRCQMLNSFGLCETNQFESIVESTPDSRESFCKWLQAEKRIESRIVFCIIAYIKGKKMQQCCWSERIFSLDSWTSYKWIDSHNVCHILFHSMNFHDSWFCLCLCFRMLEDDLKISSDEEDGEQVRQNKRQMIYL